MVQHQQSDLRRAVESAYARFRPSQPEAREVLFDRHFVEKHLAAKVAHRLQGGCGVDALWLLGEWGAHLGVSPAVLARHTGELKPFAEGFLRHLRSEVQALGPASGARGAVQVSGC